MLCVVQLHGACNGACAIQHRLDTATVVGNGSVHCGGGRREVGHAPAHAVAQGAHAARHLWPGLDGLNCHGGVGHRVGSAVGLHQLHRSFAVGAHIAQFHTRGLAPEDIWRQHHKAGQRVLLGHAADVLIDAKDLLPQDQARAAAAGRQGQVAGEAGRQMDPVGLDG